LENLGHECFYFAGESEWPEDRTYLVEEAHFEHPEVKDLNADLFDDDIRAPKTTRSVQRLQNYLKDHLHRYLSQFDLDLLIVENALSLPMNVPLGLALTELIAETKKATIAHHHDFSWERSRYSVSAADDYIGAAFPPTLMNLRHVVINSFAARQLAWRKGVSSTIMPNVMDFDHPPAEPGDYATTLRADLGIPQAEHFLLQPTRIVPRKRIEIAIELARRMDLDCALVISHHSGDEGTAYETYLRKYADMLDVKVLFAADRFAHDRGEREDGKKVYSLRDGYQQADLVTYPSRVEGFGNAFLETIYYRKPILMSTYDIFLTDIQPKGFQVIGFGDFPSEECVQHAMRVLETPEIAEEMVETNYRLGRRHFSYAMLERNLSALIRECLGVSE
jgi:glycosyltransferase involved in cell wall biosynthesis